MRRNTPWNQGRGRGPPGRNNGPRGASSRDYDGGDLSLSMAGRAAGPDHQLHDLDLELALLKRKRELIEQQQTMIIKDNYGSSSQYRFDQQPRDGFGQQFSSMRKYSDLYEERGQGDRFDRRGASLKRSGHAISVWETDAPPKRPGPSPRPRRSGPAHPPPPLMTAAVPRPKFQPPRDRPSFKPSARVTKPRQQYAAPNKLASYPVAERKKLVEQATATSPSKGDGLVFDSKQATAPKVLGRLELALGNILREMRSEFGGAEPHAKTFAESQGQRTLKQALRDRIRAVMDGRVVGPCTQIMALYRDKYPKTTDLALLNKIGNHKNRPKNLAIDIFETANPERYFNANFNKLLGHSLTKLLQKVQEVYKDEAPGFKVLSQAYDEFLAELDLEVANTSEAIKVSEENKNATAVEDNVAEGGENTVEAGETVEGAEQEEGEQAEGGEQVTETGNNTEEGNEETETTENAVQDVKEDDAKNEISIDLSDLPNPNVKIDMQEYNEETMKAKFYMRLVDKLLRRQLPVVLPRFKRFILSIIKSDPEYVETKDYLIKTAKEKLDAYAPKPDKEVTSEKPARPPIATTDGKPLYVKIVGRPTLPRKKSMKMFLDKFKPILIKKHRNVHNMLFVAFDNQENFEQILAKSGTMFGHIKVEIKVSEKLAQNSKDDKNEPKDNDNEFNNTNDANDASDCLDESLDGQITDLLCTIRQEEEMKVDDEANTTGVNNATSIENIEPSGENTEAAVENSKTSAENTEASAEIIQASTENTEASAQNTEASAENTEASVENIEASVKNTEVNEAPEMKAAVENADASIDKANAPVKNFEEPMDTDEDKIDSILKETENTSKDNNDVEKVKEGTENIQTVQEEKEKAQEVKEETQNGEVQQEVIKEEKTVQPQNEENKEASKVATRTSTRISATPKTVAAAPKSTPVAPKSTQVAPKTVATPKPTAGAPKTTATTPKPTAAAPKGTVATPTNIAASKGTVASPKSTAAPKIAVATPKSTAAPKIAVATPKSTAAAPKPAVATPKSTAAASKPAAATPKSTAAAPKAAVATLKSTAVAPKTTAAAPKPAVVTAAKSIATRRASRIGQNN